MIFFFILVPPFYENAQNYLAGIMHNDGQLCQDGKIPFIYSLRMGILLNIFLV